MITEKAGGPKPAVLFQNAFCGLIVTAVGAVVPLPGGLHTPIFLGRSLSLSYWYLKFSVNRNFDGDVDDTFLLSDYTLPSNVAFPVFCLLA